MEQSYITTLLSNNHVSIREVAQRAGVSAAAVSLALTGKVGVSEKTRSIICATADELGYVPNKTAQTLNRSAIKIGIMCTMNPPIIQNKFKSGFSGAVGRHSGSKLDCILQEYNNSDEAKGEILAGFASCEDFDGYIIGLDSVEEEKHAEVIERINRLGRPVVLLVNDTSKINNVGSVSVDAELSARMAADIMGLSLHDDRRVVIFTGDERIRIHSRYVNSFTQAAKLHGITVEKRFQTFDSPETAGRLAMEYFRNNTVGGVFCTSYLAWSVCNVLGELGLAGKIPVVGLDLVGENIDCLRNGSLSAVLHQRQERQAQQALRMLLDAIIIGTENKKRSTVLVRPQIVTASAVDAFL